MNKLGSVLHNGDKTSRKHFNKTFYHGYENEKGILWNCIIKRYLTYYPAQNQQLNKTYIMNINLPCYNPEDSELLYISQKQLKQSWISIQPKPCDVTDTKNEEKVWCVHPKSNSIIHNKKTFKVFFISMQEHFNLAKSNSWLLFLFCCL